MVGCEFLINVGNGPGTAPLPEEWGRAPECLFVVLPSSEVVREAPFLSVVFLAPSPSISSRDAGLQLRISQRQSPAATRDQYISQSCFYSLFRLSAISFSTPVRIHHVFFTR